MKSIVVVVFLSEPSFSRFILRTNFFSCFWDFYISYMETFNLLRLRNLKYTNVVCQVKPFRLSKSTLGMVSGRC